MTRVAQVFSELPALIVKHKLIYVSAIMGKNTLVLARNGTLKAQNTTNKGTAGMDRLHFMACTTMNDVHRVLTNYPADFLLLVPKGTTAAMKMVGLKNALPEHTYSGELKPDSQQKYISANDLKKLK